MATWHTECTVLKIDNEVIDPPVVIATGLGDKWLLFQINGKNVAGSIFVKNIKYKWKVMISAKIDGKKVLIFGRRETFSKTFTVRNPNKLYCKEDKNYYIGRKYCTWIFLMSGSNRRRLWKIWESMWIFLLSVK